MQMQVHALAGDIQHVVLDGSFDIEGVARVDLPFARLAGAHRLIFVDMSGVTFLASIGIRTLITSARTVTRGGGNRHVMPCPLPML